MELDLFVVFSDISEAMLIFYVLNILECDVIYKCHKSI